MEYAFLVLLIAIFAFMTWGSYTRKCFLENAEEIAELYISEHVEGLVSSNIRHVTFEMYMIYAYNLAVSCFIEQGILTNNSRLFHDTQNITLGLLEKAYRDNGIRVVREGDIL